MKFKHYTEESDSKEIDLPGQRELGLHPILKQNLPFDAKSFSSKRILPRLTKKKIKTRKSGSYLSEEEILENAKRLK